MTKKQLEKFVKMRNASEYSSNLQFQIDADECGFKVKDLGDPKRVMDSRVKDLAVGYCWETPHGVLVEVRHRLFLYESMQEFKSVSEGLLVESVALA